MVYIMTSEGTYSSAETIYAALICSRHYGTIYNVCVPILKNSKKIVTISKANV